MTNDDLVWMRRAKQVLPDWLFVAGPAFTLRVHIGALLMRAHRWLWLNF